MCVWRGGGVESEWSCAFVCVTSLLASNLSFGVGSGTLIAVPIPEEASGLGEEIEGAIQRALTEAQ